LCCRTWRHWFLSSWRRRPLRRPMFTNNATSTARGSRDLRKWRELSRQPSGSVLKRTYTVLPISYLSFLLHVYKYIQSSLLFLLLTTCFGLKRPSSGVLSTVALYKLFIYLYTCKCDVSSLIYLTNTQYLFVLINFTQFLI
jgi:hypothetical protein